MDLHKTAKKGSRSDNFAIIQFLSNNLATTVRPEMFLHLCIPRDSHYENVEHITSGHTPHLILCSHVKIETIVQIKNINT